MWRVWWIYGALLSVAVSIINLVLGGTSEKPDVVALGIAVVATGLWCVMLWRCANNNDIGVGPLVRASLIAGVLGMSAMALLFRHAISLS